MRRTHWIGLSTLAIGLAWSTTVEAFPWKKAYPVQQLPPYYGYYPTQWREFPASTDITVVTPATPTKPPEMPPVETLPEPKKSLTSTSSVRGTAPIQSSGLIPIDSVPRLTEEKIVPAARLGEPQTPLRVRPAASLGNAISGSSTGLNRIDPELPPKD